MSKQQNKWASDLGDAYTHRNPQTIEEMDNVHFDKKGVTRTAFTQSFFMGFNLEIYNVLEIGCNVGFVLHMLHKFGYKNLYGIDINQHALDIAKEKAIGKDIYVIKGSAFDIPFKDSFFNLVLSNGLLVHIAPNDIDAVMDEMYRCSRKYIWGYEYYSERYEEIAWKYGSNLVWKADFARLFMDRYSDLILLKEEKITYVKHPELVDSMFLLEKVI